MRLCYRCGSQWQSERSQPYFHQVCDDCQSPLHVCHNCKHHDAALSNQCRIPTTEWVPDRAKDNYCCEFEFLDSVCKNDTSVRARQVFDDLFQGDAGAKHAAVDGSDDARRKFERLFRP